MPSITLKDELLYQKLKKYAEETNTTISDITEDMVFDFLTRKGKDTSAFDDYYIRKEDLEVQATNLINTTLPAHIAAFAKEIAYLNLKIPLWQHLMGIYRLAHDQGNFLHHFWILHGLQLKSPHSISLNVKIAVRQRNLKGLDRDFVIIIVLLNTRGNMIKSLEFMEFVEFTELQSLRSSLCLLS